MHVAVLNAHGHHVYTCLCACVCDVVYVRVHIDIALPLGLDPLPPSCRVLPGGHLTLPDPRWRVALHQMRSYDGR